MCKLLILFLKCAKLNVILKQHERIDKSTPQTSRTLLSYRWITAGSTTKRDNAICLQLQELEMENAQLKKNLNSLRKTVSSASPASAQQNLMSKFTIASHYLCLVHYIY